MSLRWKIAQKAEFSWWKNYLSGKRPSDYLRQKAAYWESVIALAGVDILPGDRVLDAGCGPAGIFMILKDQKVDAVDPLLDRYEQGLEVFQRTNYPNVHFFTENLEGFQHEAPYPVVFCLNAINHVKDIAKSFHTLSQAVAPGGTLVMSVDAHRFVYCKWLFRALPGDILHPQQNDDVGYTALLTSAGFEINRKVILKEEFIFRHYLYVAQKTCGNDR